MNVKMDAFPEHAQHLASQALQIDVPRHCIRDTSAYHVLVNKYVSEVTASTVTELDLMVWGYWSVPVECHCS